VGCIESLFVLPTVVILIQTGLIFHGRSTIVDRSERTERILERLKRLQRQILKQESLERLQGFYGIYHRPRLR
jgi:hypothetical protein